MIITEKRRNYLSKMILSYLKYNLNNENDRYIIYMYKINSLRKVIKINFE